MLRTVYERCELTNTALHQSATHERENTGTLQILFFITTAFLFFFRFLHASSSRKIKYLFYATPRVTDHKRRSDNLLVFCEWSLNTPAWNERGVKIAKVAAARQTHSDTQYLGTLTRCYSYQSAPTVRPDSSATQSSVAYQRLPSSPRNRLK